MREGIDKPTHISIQPLANTGVSSASARTNVYLHYEEPGFGEEGATVRHEADTIECLDVLSALGVARDLLHKHWPGR